VGVSIFVSVWLSICVSVRVSECVSVELSVYDCKEVGNKLFEEIVDWEGEGAK
jgi:hypothetical protein